MVGGGMYSSAFALSRWTPIAENTAGAEVPLNVIVFELADLKLPLPG